MLFGRASAFADSTSLIGKKVQGLYSVVMNGPKIADAVIINGTADAPVRAVSQAGATLAVDGKKIIVNNTNSENPSTLKTTSGQKTRVELQANRDEISDNIAKLETGIMDLEINVIPPLEALAKELANNGTLGK